MQPFIAQHKRLRGKRVEVLDITPAMLDYLVFDKETREFEIIKKDVFFKDYVFVKYSGA